MAIFIINYAQKGRKIENEKLREKTLLSIHAFEVKGRE